jgi:hypothetical protein
MPLSVNECNLPEAYTIAPHRSTSAGKCSRAGKTQIAKASHQLYFARRQSAKVWILALSFYSMSCKVYR